ncbi:FtsX-like permease family protein [Dyadobacter fanqingshengii]|uniref:ABC transporter permease n=1 Tax=Dyadobacter fanqingshengii TaxID=2906443 RepID=A0A9X1P9V8_9BACT|nr:FtsX-like permease family protein [Dyadobacter fanqingshengii]MCF0040018.1 ABC transporter permease [Dyadobacter fanqingshengii]USJ38230.1 ABC transporter permease [Dyadobacter fanqingshengii]
MLQNYFKIAWRNLVRSKTYSLLILCGLATGMTCAVLLGLYVHDELSFDRYHAQADDIYRLNLNVKWADNEYNMGHTSAPFGPTIKQEYAEVKDMLRIKPRDLTFRVGEKAAYVKQIVFADPSIFRFFEYKFTEGNGESALSGQNSVVLTEKLALILFGKTSGLIGKVVIVKDSIPMTISAIMQNAPANHHLTFDAVLPYENRQVNAMNLLKWDSFNTWTYLRLDHRANVGDLEAKMPAFYKKYIAKVIGDDTGTKVSFKIALQALTDIHLKSSHLLGEENGSSMAYVYTFATIALFILVIAIVNYVNLATARSLSRAKEIGVRKAVGSQKSQLIKQFLTESMLMSFMALTLSIVLIILLLPVFNTMADKSLTFNFGDAGVIRFLIGFAALTGLLSGIYPAFVLSKFKPALVLKGASSGADGGQFLRKSLVVLQFSISIVMILGTIVVYRQLQYMRNSELGFDQEQVITLSLRSPAAQKSAEVLKNRVLESPLVQKVSLADGNVGDGLNNKTTFSFYAKGAEIPIGTEYFHVDADFLDVMKIKVKEGAGFSQQISSDSSFSVVVNQAMIKRLGWKDRTAGLIEVDTKRVPVTGVISDFHLRSLHNQIEPLVLVLKKHNNGNLYIRVSGENTRAALQYVQEVFEETNPGQPFEYAFLDQTFAKQYQSDERKGSIFLSFSGIAIFIACVGLFGLATFTAERRTKEIGVRKVLGASVASVFTLLSADFLKLVAISILIAAPVGGYMMRVWLQNFAYQTKLEWWMFALAGSLSILVALLTVSFQSIKAALKNPVESLRSE